MRKILPNRLELGRVVTGEMASHPSWGAYGQFFLQGPCGERLCIVASGGEHWMPIAGYEGIYEVSNLGEVKALPKIVPLPNGAKHVSISTRRRPPNWQEMCFVKDLFWSEEECVIQFHPPRSEYVNNHPHCLHLWRPTDGHVRLPPSILVGRKDLGLLTQDQAAALRAAQ